MEVAQSEAELLDKYDAAQEEIASLKAKVEKLKKKSDHFERMYWAKTSMDENGL